MGFALRLKGFLGEVPRTSPEMLPDTNAQYAMNTLLTSGRLDPIYAPKAVSTAALVSAPQSIYRMYDSAGSSYWLNWAADVDCTRGPIAGDTTFRTYFTSASFEPRVTNLAMATASAPYPAQWYALGVVPPATAPTVTESGGTATAETRAYVYTLQSQWGEESAPSPASSLITGPSDATWTVAGLPAAAPLNTFSVTGASWAGGVATLTVASTWGMRVGEYITAAGMNPSGYNATSVKVTAVTSTSVSYALAANPGAFVAGGTFTRDAPHNTTGMTVNVYRSVVAATGSADYYYVGSVAIGTTSLVDSAGSNVGEPLPTVGWVQPPTDLQGLKLLPNGSMVGFSGNLVCYSEPGVPYAWPVAYQQTAEYPIVNVGRFGTSVAILTQGAPYISQGTDPSAMTLTRLAQSWPCLSKRGMCEIGSVLGWMLPGRGFIEIGDGVIYPAPVGLVVIGAAGNSLASEQFFTITEFAPLNASTFNAGMYDNKYYASYTDTSGNPGMIVFDITGQSSLVRTSVYPKALWTDPATGYLWIVDSDNLLKQWNADASNTLPITWWSKEFVVADPFNLGAAKLDAQFYVSTAQQAASEAAIQAQISAQAALFASGQVYGSLNAATCNKYSLNGSAIVPSALIGQGAEKNVIFEIYGDGDLLYSTTITDTNPFRLPSGSKYHLFSVKVISTVSIDSIVVGETFKGLMQV